MKVVRPIEITEAVLTASSIPEPDASVGEVEWDSTRSDGKPVSEVSDGVAVASDNLSYSVIGWNTTSLIATAYIYDDSFAYQSSVTFASGSPYISGNRQDVCFDGSKYWFANGDQISRYNSDWTHDGTTIDTDANFFNAWAQAICSDGTFVYVTMRNNTDLNYFIAKYKISDSSFVESKIIQQNIEINIKGSEVVGGRIIHFARFSGDSAPLKAYETSLDLIGFSEVSIVSSKSPIYDTGLSKIDSGFVTLNNNDNKLNLYDSAFDPQGLYQVEDRVIKTSTHKLYECTIATADDPEVGVDKKPQTWVEVGPTNKWATFDDKKSTKSKSSSPYTIQLVPGVTIDSLAGFAISGATDVTIVATSASAGEVFNGTINLLNIDLAYDFYTWYTYELDYIDEFVVTNIPPYPDLTIDISFTGTAIEVGNIVTGRGRNLGVLQTGVISDRVDYSRTTIDDFGEEATVIRPITKYSTYPIVIEKVQAPSVLRFLDGLRGLKCVWIGDIGNGQNLTTFGSIERSPLTYDTLSISEYQIKVRGSI